MKALCWHGKSDIRCDTVLDPKIEAPRDAILTVRACAICGSDLYFFNGVIPEMKSGDVVGHETISFKKSARASKSGMTSSRRAPPDGCAAPS